MTGLIKQPCGIGDIFFLQKAANLLLEQNQVNNIIWPVNKEFSYIGDYIINDKIEFISVDDFMQKYPELQQFWHFSGQTPKEGYQYFGFQSADLYFPGISVMDAKYKLLDITPKDWQNYFTFRRNKKRETDFFYSFEQTKKPYIVVNRNYGSPPNEVKCPYINLDTDLEVIEMTIEPNTHIFDWCMVLENAVQIHTVETSLNYIIEKLNNLTGLNMYSKHNPPSYSAVRHLFKKPWVYHL